MYLPPRLEPLQAKVLQVLLDRSNIAGYELMSLTSESSDALIPAVTALRNSELIQVVGNLSNAKDFQFSRFAVLPTAKSLASTIAKYSA